jgi:hypothetical protein
MNISATRLAPLARRNGLVIQELSDETLVYDLDSNKAHCLNPSAAFVWKACDGKTSAEQIAVLFASSGIGTVTSDFVWLAIDQLNENNLLEKPVARFHGESRRQVIKKIGLTSMVALPIIASLVAPQSALATGSCACIAPGDCLVQTTCPSQVNCNGLGICAT